MEFIKQSPTFYRIEDIDGFKAKRALDAKVSPTSNGDYTFKTPAGDVKMNILFLENTILANITKKPLLLPVSSIWSYMENLLKKELGKPLDSKHQ